MFNTKVPITRLLLSSFIGVICTALLALILTAAASAVILTVQNPQSLIPIAAIVIIQLSCILGGFLSHRASKSFSASLLCSALMIMISITVNLLTKETDEFSEIMRVIYYISIFAFCTLGAFISIKTDSKRKRKKRIHRRR